MNFFKNIFVFFWRIWFYGWVLFTIIPVAPILIIIILKEEWYPIFFKIAKAWAKTILFVMGFKVKVEADQEIDPKKSYVFAPNHTSMIDIMLMLSITKNPFVFIGKAELAKIPVFGFFYKRTNILVDRSNSKSRKKAFEEADRRLKNGISICVFPEGMVPDESIILAEFKSGAFRLAIEHKVPIVPITFYDCKKRFSYTFFSGGPGKLRVKIHKFIETKNLKIEDHKKIKQIVYDLLYNSLTTCLPSKK
jgi:1-acyl-sn-glycerol-3-phosphate acyltransferase